MLLLSLALDLVAMAVLTYAIYFRRHHRRDLTLGFMGVNIGLFAVASFVSTKPLGLAFGIGLFALLSVIRLRSTQITQEEIGYYFVAIVVGLVAGLSPEDHWAATVTLVVVLVGVMYVADHPVLLRGYERRMVRLKRVYHDDDELRAALEAKLAGTVLNVYVLETDYAQKTTRVDVRFRPDPPGTARTRTRRSTQPGGDGARIPAPATTSRPGDGQHPVPAPPGRPSPAATTTVAPARPPAADAPPPATDAPPPAADAPLPHDPPDEMRLDVDDRWELP
ncbi:MAG: DUF4956 domain-containing protein [Actinobacteria bacterium]|nr:DUF4956 domain-containing protein [Actinomycetota bacterium]